MDRPCHDPERHATIDGGDHDEWPLPDPDDLGGLVGASLKRRDD
jgi:hypothetical protein